MSDGFSEGTRKLVHVAMGLFALALAFLAWWQALLLAIAALAHNLFILPLYLRKRIFRGQAGERGHDIGIILYPASIVVLILVFHNHLEIVAAAWALLAFGDGFATIAGKTIGGPRLPWNRAKTWSGYCAFIVVGFMAARFLYVWTFFGQFLGAEASTPSSLRTLHAGEVYEGFLKESLPTHLGWAIDLHYWLSDKMGPWSSTSAFAGCFRALSLMATQLGWGWAFVTILLATTFLAATLESLPIGVDDNVVVTLVPAGFLYALSLYNPASWSANRDQVLSNLPWALLINVLLAAGAYAARSVSFSGVAGGILVGGALFAFGGWRAFMMLVVFFVLGTAATKTGFVKKAALGIAQEKGGRRGAKNAVANCGVGAVLAFVAATTPYGHLAMLGLVAAFATAAADTVSSEIGQAYGKRTFLITTFRPVPPGTEGAVSLEGTLAGIGAGAIVALAGLGPGLVTPPGAALVVAAAFFGSTLESYMGALWERAKLIDNEAVNFANTLAGALFAIGAATLLKTT